MAVITAAIAAVTAAIATTTVATVATAVVAVSTAVGVAGLAVGGIGMAIGNEDLMFAGKIMGYVGLAGGLAGGVIGGVGGALSATPGMTFGKGFADAFAGASQHLSNAWDKGVGSWFSGGKNVTNAVGGAADDVAGAADDVAAAGAKPAMSSPNGKMAAFPEAPNPGTSVPYAGDGVTVGPKTNMFSPTASSPGVPTAPAVASPVAPVAPGAPYSSMNNGLASWAPNAQPTSASSGLVGSLTNSFSSMPDWMKYSLMTTGAQGLTGLAGGYFQGKHAQAQLDQQRLQMDRDQQQREFLNYNANAIPTLRFA